jgi:uncharacterized lipoprotein YddW (UPF0748 family)
MLRPAVIVLAALVLALASFAPAAEEAPPPRPAPDREFRAVWVATVANIDWPSKPGLPIADQKRELLRIIETAQALNFNAIILQVRPMCDALYASKLEPWSGFLTGEPGKDPGWDPLAFAVAESHRRGLELHAWFNPYRARTPTSRGALPDSHISKQRPDLVKEYGKHLWLNPTAKDVREHSLAVALDVVERYDVDGVHMDDYFYPYPEADADKKEIPFPDDDTWKEYTDGSGTLSRSDWRRDAVNAFVEQLYERVKKAKPWVKIGISPFGIWRPGHPPGIEGFNQYEKLYADAKLWFNRGWVDYFTPQLYWPIAQEKQSYPRLLAWWAGENAHDRHLWPGNFTSRVNTTDKGWPAAEIGDQIAATRKHPGASGNVHFSYVALTRKPVADVLAKAYPQRALVPASPWLGATKPGKPELSWGEGNAIDRKLQVRPPEGDPVRHYVIRQLVGGEWLVAIRAATSGREEKDGRFTVVAGIDPRATRVVVTAISRTGVEGEPAELKP